MLRRLNSFDRHFGAVKLHRAFSSVSVQKYDYLVIGAGSGGIASARRAALLGKKVALVEQKVIGGTCVNVGCVPKKVMFNLAMFLEDATFMKRYGVKGLEHLKLDFGQFKQARDAYVKRLNDIYMRNVAASGITYFEGMGQFVSNDTVEVSKQNESAARLTSEHILIASGGKPSHQGIVGEELCMDSNDFFAMEELPESVCVIGGGYIAVELAQILHGLGVKTTLIVRSVPLRFVDQEIISLLVDEISASGIDVRLQTSFDGVQKLLDGKLRVQIGNGGIKGHVDAEKVLLAIGRPPNTEDLGLEHTSVKKDERSGHILVDEYQNTDQKGVYALGDVTKAPALTPVAVRAGRILSERLFNNRPTLKTDNSNVATVVFSHPPIGTVGLSEDEATKKFGAEGTVCYRSKFGNMFYGLTPNDSGEHKPQSLFKLICHKQDGTERVVGVHGIGRGIDEMMQTASVALNMGATKQDFDNSIAIHPTASEELVLMDTKYED